MKRLLAPVWLAVALTCLASLPGEAAPPPAQDPTRRDGTAELFAGAVPKNLDDLKALEARVQKVMQKVIPATVGLGGGSGVIVSKDGLILTAAHVGQKKDRPLTITFPNGKTVKGKVLGNYHRPADAGMAQITDKGDYPFVEVGKSGTLKPGQWVIAMGYPVSFTRGQKPPVRIGRVLRVDKFSVTTDCPLMGGDSGGPLFDLEGRVIGINSRVSGGITGNVHVAADAFHSNWDRLLKGDQWGTPSTTTKGKGKGKGKSDPTTEFDLLTAAPPPAKAVQPAPTQPPGRFTRRSSPHERNIDAVKSAFREAVAPAAASTVRVLVNDQAASLGTIVSADGLIVTKATLLKGNISCRLADGRVVTAERLGEDKEYDLAVLRIQAKGLKAVSWRKDGPPPQGSLVAAVSEKGAALSVGLVTAEPRQFRVMDRGPRTTKGGTAPAAPRAFLGVGVDDQTGSVKALRVNQGSGAAKAGLKVDDVIKSAAGTAITSSDQLIELVQKQKVGDKLVLVVDRGGKEMTLTAVLGRQVVAASYDRWGGGPFSTERRFGYGKVLPHDTVLLPTDCGGPLVDTSGRVVGVNISRALRVATYALLPADVERIVHKIAPPKKTAAR